VVFFDNKESIGMYHLLLVSSHRHYQKIPLPDKYDVISPRFIIQKHPIVSDWQLVKISKAIYHKVIDCSSNVDNRDPINFNVFNISQVPKNLQNKNKELISQIIEITSLKEEIETLKHKDFVFESFYKH
jgi:hypothetical protein